MGTSFAESWRWSFHLIVGYTPRELLYDKPQYGVALALGFGCNFLYLKLIDAE